MTHVYGSSTRTATRRIVEAVAQAALENPERLSGVSIEQGEM
jgi:hypothetical protein